MSLEQLIQSGFALIPVPRGQKGPARPGWNARSAAITDLSGLDQLVGGNVGLAHAYCTPDPTCAIDIDHYQKSREWLGALGVDLKVHLLAPGSVAIWSGKPQSIKLIYRLPHGSTPLLTRQVADEQGKMILEFRCASKNGMTVQDLLPPSIHPSGTQYKWVGQGSPQALPTIPNELLNVWLNLSKRRKGPCKRRAMDTINWPETPRRVAQVHEMLRHISAECDYITWRNIVWSLLSTGWDCAEEIARQWSQTSTKKYSDSAFQSVVESYNPDHGNRHSIGTVIHHAKLGGWYE